MSSRHEYHKTASVLAEPNSSLQHGNKGTSSITVAFLIIAILIISVAAGLTLINYNQKTSNSSTTSRQTSTLSSNSTSKQSTAANSSSSSSSLSNLPTISTATTTTTISTSSASQSSSKIQTTATSSSLITFGGVAYGYYDFPATDSIYNSVNGYLYASWWAYSQGNYNDNFLIVTSNSTAKTITITNQPFIGTVFLKSYNSNNGSVFVLYPGGGGGHNGGCDFSTYGIMVGTNFTHQGQFLGTDAQGLTGANVYNNKYGYFAFAEGGPQTGSNPCRVGTFIWGNNSSRIFVSTGIQPSQTIPNNFGPSGWFGFIPSLAYNSLNGEIYVPVLNESINYNNGSVVPNADATYFYTVNGYSALPINYTFPGLTQSLLFDNSSQNLYAQQLFGNNNSIALLVINPSTGSTLGRISLSGNSPMVYDVSNKMVYVFEKSQVLEISGTKVINTYMEPTSQPTSVVYNQGDNEIAGFCNCTSTGTGTSSSPLTSLIGVSSAQFTFAMAASLTILLSVTYIRKYQRSRYFS